MKKLFTLSGLSRSEYTIGMILSVAIAFFSYMILLGFLMGGVDIARIIIAVPASCVLIMIYLITRRLIDIYKYLGILALFYFFILYSMFSYDATLHNGVSNVNGFIYYMIGIALAFLLAFVPKLGSIDNTPVMEEGVYKYKTSIQIIFLIVLGAIIPNVLIPEGGTMYQPPGSIQSNTTTKKIELPTQNYGSYLDTNSIKVPIQKEETKKDNTIYVHIPNN